MAYASLEQALVDLERKGQNANYKNTFDVAKPTFEMQAPFKMNYQ